MGISVRRLLGWEPAEVTTFEYDEAGRVTQTITVREPEYSDMDRGWLLESRAQEKAPRGPHGWLMSEATDPANRGKFFVGPPLVDFAAQVELEAREEAAKVYKGKFPLDALKFKVEKKD